MLLRTPHLLVPHIGPINISLGASCNSRWMTICLNNFQSWSHDPLTFVLRLIYCKRPMVISRCIRIFVIREHMQFNPLNIVIRDTTRRTFSTILIWVSRRKPFQIWETISFWILSQKRLTVSTYNIRMRTVNLRSEGFI